MIHLSMGKRLRMRRVFRGGKALILPMDHPIYFGPQPGLEDPVKVVRLARENGATAVLITAGTLRAALDEIGDMGIVLRVDATVSHMGGPDTVMHVLHTAEEALALGADMAVVNCYVGMGDRDVESALLEKLADLSAQCETLGLPICSEIIPRASAADAARTPSSEDLAYAIRLGLEYGCDVVKTIYTGDPKGYAAAVATAAGVPVIMAGGPKSADEMSVFRHIHEAMTHGASGAVIGRRIWGCSRPEATLRAVKAIVMDGVPFEEALAIYKKG